MHVGGHVVVGDILRGPKCFIFVPSEFIEPKNVKFDINIVIFGQLNANLGCIFNACWRPCCCC